jgi:hypothetical protein
MIKKGNLIIFIIVVVLIVGAIILLVNNRAKENKDNINEENSINIEYTQDGENITNPYVEELEDGQKENNSPSLKEEKQFKEIEIKNISFIYNPGSKMTTIIADLTNSGTEEQKEEIVSLRVIGQNGEELASLNAIIPNIKSGETKTLRCSATADLSNASNFEIVEK